MIFNTRKTAEICLVLCKLIISAFNYERIGSLFWNCSNDDF